MIANVSKNFPGGAYSVPQNPTLGWAQLVPPPLFRIGPPPPWIINSCLRHWSYMRKEVTGEQSKTEIIIHTKATPTWWQGGGQLALEPCQHTRST